MTVLRVNNRSDYTFRAGSYTGDELRVLGFWGVEGLSQLFEFEVDLVSTDDAIDYEQIVGQPALLSIRGAHGVRHVHGIVSRFEQDRSEGRWTHYRAKMVPTIWLLSLHATCRIFQNQSIPNIIEQVLTDAGIATDRFRFSLRKTYKPRDYCVQYRESDLSFILRLMEQYGIFYFFEHDADKHILVFGDDPVTHLPIPEPANVSYRAPGTAGVSDREHVFAYRYNQEVRSTAVRLRDFNFQKPRLTLETESGRREEPQLEVYDYPGIYEASDEGSGFASTHLESLQTTKEIGSGESDCRRFVPGHRFTLAQHDRPSFDREYLILYVHHTGNQPQAMGAEAAGRGEKEVFYKNQFRCIPSEVPYRPPRTTPRPTIPGLQTAMVVGPQGEEIYTDKYGRVKVKFHWDRSEQRNEGSSCWVRVKQASAGPNWGMLFLPRVGHEVIVEFLEGDPDRPLVTGGVYNGENMPPYALPDEKTKSTIKTSSTPGGEGTNEIRFEDKKGAEQLFIQGEKNVDIRVKNDAYEWVGRDRHLIIKQDQIVQVENSRHEVIEADHIEQIGRDRHLTVKGKEAIKIGESHSFTVSGDVIEVFKANHSEATSEDYYLKAANIVIEAMSNITLKVGSSFIAIEAGGIKIGTSGQLKLDASGPLEIKSSAAADLKGSMISVSGDGVVEVKGGVVKIN